MLTFLVRVVLITIVLFSLSVGNVGVRAGGELAGSTPVDGATLDSVPDQVALMFDGTLDPDTVRIVVIAPNGVRADTGISETSEGARSTKLRAGLTDGRYLVYWLVAQPGTRASAFGNLSFTVEGASPCQPESNATPRPPAETCVPDPPAGAPGVPIDINGMSVTLAVSSDQAGPVDLQASVTNDAGDPIDDAVVWFRARHLEMDHGELPYLAAQSEPGVFRAEGVGMGMGGAWRIAVDVILPGELPVTVFIEQSMIE